MKFRASNHRSISVFLSGINGWRSMHRLLGHPLCLLSFVLEKLDFKYLQTTEPRTNLEWTNEMWNIFKSCQSSNDNQKRWDWQEKGHCEKRWATERMRQGPWATYIHLNGHGQCKVPGHSAAIVSSFLVVHPAYKEGLISEAASFPLTHLTLASTFLIHTGASYTCLMSEGIFNR